MEHIQKTPQREKKKPTSRKRGDKVYQKAAAAMKAKLENHGVKDGVELSNFFRGVRHEKSNY